MMGNRMRLFSNGFALMAPFLAVCCLIYAPGLSGSFAFDDTVFLIANNAVKVSTLSVTDWLAAATSFPAAHQGRWLGMLSFAANHYLTGMDPFWFKLTNLCVHLGNGTLLFLALRALFSLYQQRFAEQPAFRSGLVAAVLAGLWLVLPVNLTAVLYISQRLESLSNTFVFLGLWWYLTARIAHLQERRGPSGLWASLILCTGLGVMVKESGVLLPLYAFCVEFALTRFRDRHDRFSRPVLALYGTLLLIPLVGGLIWLTGWVDGPRSYGRAFDIPQRLLTEGRVLIDYMVWTLFPSLDALTLYHDDIKVSRSLLDPPTTLAAILAIAGLIGCAFWQRTRRPLFALGIFWFFAGHILTATIIPLMLAFEHRNYFPSVGLLLSGAALLVLEGPRLRPRLVAIGAACIFAFYAFTTNLRAIEWSSPLTLSATDAAKRPNSSAAQYEYARILLGSTLNGDPEPMRRKAFVILENMAANPEADAIHNQMLIVTSARLGLPIMDMWWESMISKLEAHPPTTVNVSALSGLLNCLEAKICPRDIEHFQRAFEAATSHPGGYAQLLSLYAKFALIYLGDFELAERQYRAAIEQAPTDSAPLANLVTFLVRTGEFDAATDELQRLRGMNRLGTLDRKIAELEQMLRQANNPGTGRTLPQDRPD